MFDGRCVRVEGKNKNKKVAPIYVIIRNGSRDHLESEIDRLIYRLYGLTKEEIKIVEGKE